MAQRRGTLSLQTLTMYLQHGRTIDVSGFFWSLWLMDLPAFARSLWLLLKESV
jgi:hypothetical protein